MSSLLTLNACRGGYATILFALSLVCLDWPVIDMSWQSLGGLKRAQQQGLLPACKAVGGVHHMHHVDGPALFASDNSSCLKAAAHVRALHGRSVLQPVNHQTPN